MKPPSKSPSKSTSPIKLRNETLTQKTKKANKPWQKNIAMSVETVQKLALPENVPQSYTTGEGIEIKKRKLRDFNTTEKTIVQKQKTTINQLATDKDQLAKAKRKLNTLVQSLTNDKKALEQEKAQLKETVKSLRTEIQAQREAQDLIENGYDNYNNNVEMDVEEDQDDVNRKIQRDELESNLSSAETEIDSLDHHEIVLNRALKENENLLIRVQELTNQIDHQNIEADRQESQTELLTAEINSLKKEIKTFNNQQNERINELNQDLINAQAAAKENTAIMSQLQENLAKLDQDTSKLQEQLQLAQDESSKRQAIINQKNQEIAGLKNQIENIEIEASPKRKFVRSVKQLPKPAQGLFATVSTGIATIGGYYAGSALSNPWVNAMNFVGHSLFSGDNLPTMGEKVVQQAIEIAPYAPYAVGGTLGLIAGGFMFSELYWKPKSLDERDVQDLT